jgi:hypothetical protein
MNLKIIMNKYKVTLLLMIDPSNGDETLKKSYTVPMMSVMLLKSRKNARK